jgi:hypothetical protein
MVAIIAPTPTKHNPKCHPPESPRSKQPEKKNGQAEKYKRWETAAARATQGPGDQIAAGATAANNSAEFEQFCPGEDTRMAISARKSWHHG